MFRFQKSQLQERGDGESSKTNMEDAPLEREEDAQLEREEDAPLEREEDAPLEREEDAPLEREEDAPLEREDVTMQALENEVASLKVNS